MSDRRELYLEHLGMFDDPNYSNRNISKLNNYMLNGKLQGDDLFITYETRDNPLDVRVLDRMIDEQFK